MLVDDLAERTMGRDQKRKHRGAEQRSLASVLDVSLQLRDDSPLLQSLAVEVGAKKARGDVGVGVQHHCRLLPPVVERSRLETLYDRFCRKILPGRRVAVHRAWT